MNLFDKAPQLGRDVFVADNAVVMGDVKLGDKASVFYGAVLRGECRLAPAPQTLVLTPASLLPQVTMARSRWASPRTCRTAPW